MGRFQCVRVDLEDDLEEISLSVPGNWSPWSEEPTAQTIAPQQSSYKSRLSLDVAQGAVAVDPGFRTGEGVQALLSDLMGNKVLFLQLGNSTVSTRDFARNFSAGATLFDLERRLNRGISLYHISGDYYDAQGLPYFERRAGGSLLLSYPFDRFNRVETSASLAYSEKKWPSRDVDRRGMIATHYLSFVRDNSLWLPTGPIDGSRSNLTVGVVMNMKRLATENALASLDLRRYFRLGLRSAYAVRLQARISHGPDPSLFLLGGSNSFRGYSYRAFVGTRAAILNQEIRFPLLRGFALGLPMGVMELPGVEGAVFFDMGQAWEERNLPDDLRGSYGLSFRMGLGGFLVLRLDLARRTDFNRWPGRVHTDFFIGWDY
jgi:outer membrane protein assembly factor BamA